MDSKQYIKLLTKLDLYISDSPVSPVTPSENFGSWAGSLSPNMSFESLTKDEKILAHSLMHRFYPRGTKTLSKQEIKTLHEKIRTEINHEDFDQLDKVDNHE